MATVLLDGTTAAFDFTSGTGAVPATPISWKCVSNYLSMDMICELFEQTTFCSTGWRSRIKGMKQMIGRLDGFSSTGLAISDPLSLFTSAAATPFVATIHTGCTLTGNLQPSRRHEGIRAAGNSEMGLDFESYGAVTSAWVVA